MQLREVLLKATARQITWGEAAEIIGVSDRTIQKWRERLEREASSAIAHHTQKRLSQERLTRGFRVRVDEREGAIAVVDETSGMLAETVLLLEEPPHRATAFVGSAGSVARTIDAIPSDHASLFLTLPSCQKPEPPKKRGMGVAPRRFNPARLSN